MRESEFQFRQRIDTRIDTLDLYEKELNDRLKILELKKLDDRLKALEKKFSQLESDREKVLTRQLLISDHKRAKDKTKYLFHGKVLNKRTLVLEGIKRYVEENEGMSSIQLQQRFPPTLQLQYGVIRSLEEVRQKEKTARFQIGDEDILHLADGKFVVCSEWNINNIGPILKIFREELGYRIDEYNNGQEKGEK